MVESDASRGLGHVSPSPSHGEFAGTGSHLPLSWPLVLLDAVVNSGEVDVMSSVVESVAGNVGIEDISIRISQS
jgi:hypothetical protein